MSILIIACSAFRRQLFPGPAVVELVVERMPVSISLGLWSLILIYLISSNSVGFYH